MYAVVLFLISKVLENLIYSEIEVFGIKLTKLRQFDSKSAYKALPYNQIQKEKREKRKHQKSYTLCLVKPTQIDTL